MYKGNEGTELGNEKLFRGIEDRLLMTKKEEWEQKHDIVFPGIWEIFTEECLQDITSGTRLLLYNTYYLWDVIIGEQNNKNSYKCNWDYYSQGIYMRKGTQNDIFIGDFSKFYECWIEIPMLFEIDESLWSVEGWIR